MTGLSWVFRNAGAQPPGDDHSGLLVGLQRDLALEMPTHSRLGSILGRGGADERTLCTEAAAAAGGCSSRGAWPASPSLSFPLVGPGRLWGGSAAVCHLLLQTSVLAAFHAGELSVLPPPIPPAAPPSLSGEKVVKMGVQTAGRCSKCSGPSRCRAASSPSLVPGRPDLQASGELTGVPGLRKPNRDNVYICKADACE